MSNRIDILSVVQEFSVKSLFDDGVDVSSFQSEYQSYTYFLQKFAADYENDKITKTYLIVRNSDCKIIAYFTIMPGSVTVYRDTRPDSVSPKIDELGTLHIHHLAADKEAVENYKHIENILADKNFIHHIITNKPSFPTKRVLKKLDAEKYFASVMSPNSLNPEKRMSKQEMFSHLKNKFSHEKFVGIGDSASDCTAALQNGIVAVGVLWGTGTEEELRNAGCLLLVKDVQELHEKFRMM